MKRVKVGQEFKSYRGLCKYLGEPIKGGKSKTLQVEDWNRYFTFTKQDNSNKLIIDKVYDEPLPKVRKKCKDTSNYNSNNTKNIQPMIDYFMSYWDMDGLSEYFSMTNWYCNQLGLLNKDVCNIVYQGEDEIKYYCEYHSITNQQLLSEYVSKAKSILKKTFLTSLRRMEKQGLIEYEDGFMFIYRLGEISKGHFNTTNLNEIIKSNEIKICDKINKEHNLSEKLTGRQNLLVIYGKKDLTDKFNDMRISAIMEDKEALKICNSAIDNLVVFCREKGEHISEEYPLLNYYRGISITSIEEEKLFDDDTDALGMEVCNIIRMKVRKDLLEKNYVNKYTGETVYTYEDVESKRDILKIEKILFKYFDIDMVDDIRLELDDDEKVSDDKELEEWLKLI